MPNDKNDPINLISKNDPTIKEIFSRLEFCEGRIGGGKVTEPGKSAPKADKNKAAAETTSATEMTPSATETAAQEDASGDAPAP